MTFGAPARLIIYQEKTMDIHQSKLTRFKLAATLILILLSAGLFSSTALACASCGCSLSTDWESQGASHGSGFSVDLRYDYLNQDQLRHGTSTITPAGEYSLNPNAEVESYTKNQYVTLNLGYANKDNWSVAILLPYIIRQHETWGTSSPGSPANSSTLGGNAYTSDFSQIGDAKIMVNFHPLINNHSLGFTVGIKLPTGDTNQTGIQTGVTPITSTLVDPELQPGTGTTDLIAGISYHDALSRDWDYFSQAMFQLAVAGNTQSYHPGNGTNVNFGVRYMSSDWLIPQIQVNARHVNTDGGALADTLSTGGTLIYLSPGLSVRVAGRASVYGFVQIPLYQNLSGFQLAPRFTASLGMHYAF